MRCSIALSLILLPALGCPDPMEEDDSTLPTTTSTSSDTGTTTDPQDSSSGTTSGPSNTTSSSEDTGPSGSSSDTADSGDESSSGTGPVDCLELEVAAFIGLGEGDNAIIGLTIPQLGDERAADIVQIELYDAPPPLDMPIDLSVAPNDNYATCGQCVRLLEDVMGMAITRQYFVDSGSITFTELGAAGEMAGSFADLRFIEVTLDGDFNSIPVPGGDCIEINGVNEFDTIPGG